MTAVTPAREIINTIVNMSLAPTLKAEGFQKKRFYFVRRRGSTAQSVKLELSSWNQGSDGSFKVGVGVFFDDMWRDSGVPPLFPAADAFHFHCNLFAVCASAPHTFMVTADMSLSEASTHLTDLIIKGVVEPLNTVSSLADFEATGWANKIPWRFPAMLAYHLGRDDEAARLIAEEAEFFKDRGLTEAELIQRLGLLRLKN